MILYQHAQTLHGRDDTFLSLQNIMQLVQRQDHLPQ